MATPNNTSRPRSRARAGKPMAQTEKVFRDILCEGRALPAETSDPAGARVIDELRKQVKELKAELEGERVKSRQLIRDHERDIRTLHEESERKLDTTVESLTVRKDQERAAEVKKVEERLEKQKENELRIMAKDHADEIRMLQRKFQHDKEEGIRLAVEEERRRYSEEFLHVFPEDEVIAREGRLTKELFVLGEQNHQLEEQVKNLTKENRMQIELLRKMKHEYSMEVESVVKQNKIEASREMAQLQLAERIIAEKEHELHEVGAKADQFMIEKEFLEEELATVRTSLGGAAVATTQENTTATTSTPPQTRRSVGGAAGVMQRRLEELEAAIKKLEEDKAEMKQENASLRKKLVQQGGSGGGGGVGSGSGDTKALQEKIVKLRKRNADLMNLTKKLDERCTALKVDNEQLRKQDSTPQDLEHQVRKSVARQHTKDLQEYMKQIHAKDKELSELKRKLAKFEVASPSRSDSAPELEKKMRSLAMEKLRMEKLITKLYSKLPDVVEDVGVSHSELEVESHHAEALAQENTTLKSQLEELHQRLSQREEVDSTSTTRQQLEQYERECRSLKQSRLELEGKSSELEQRCHELSQKLRVSELAVQELEGASGQYSLLEEQLGEANRELEQTKRNTQQLEEKLPKLTASIREKDSVIELLEADKDSLEVKVRERDNEIQNLRSMLKEVQATPIKAVTTETGVQATPPSQERAHVDAGIQVTSPSQQGIDAGIQTEYVKEVELRAKGEELQAKRTERESAKNDKIKESIPPQSAKITAHHDQARVKKVPTSPRTSVGVDQAHSQPLTAPQNSSLESEMRVAGIEVTDPYDSSEGVGFSDSCNLDEVPDSMHSLDSFKSDRIKEESSTITTVHSAVPMASSIVDQQPSSTIAKQQTAGGVASVNLDLQEEEAESSSDEHMTSSDGDLRPRNDQGVSMIDGDGLAGSGSEPSVFIVKYNYDPSKMSPNPNHEAELTLVAGDYIYVYGEMDGDGFYHAQLTTGEEGLVPSNFIELVEQGEDDDALPTAAVAPAKPDRRRRSSQLQDITEEEEEISSGSGSSEQPLLPPLNLELDRQFVEGDGYGVALTWTPPSPFPPHAIGYNVYVNGELMSVVEGVEKSSVIISGVPRKQLVKITVHTVSEEGESPPPSKPIILNPQYPDPPCEVEVSETEKSLLVSWQHKPSLPESNPVTSFTVHLNGEKCSQLPASATSQCVEILPKDLKRLDEEVTIGSSVQLTVRALAGYHESRDSQPLLLTRKQLALLLSQHSKMLGSEESSSSEVSMSSSEEEKKSYSPAKVENSQSHVTTEDGHVTPIADHVTNGVQENNQHSQQEGPVRYYRALYDYDPFYHSPNEEDVEDELGFKAGDIIIAHGAVGEDGFVEGELGGKVGFAPSNMLEEITDEEELAQISTLLARGHAQNTLNGRERPSVGMDGSVTKMRAIYDYDPAQDSPNTESGSETELAFAEGDVLTVFGQPDEDGFFQAELSGKKGLAPSNFLEEVSFLRDGGVEVFAADEEAVRRAEEIIHKASLASPVSESENRGNKKSSRGKGLLSSLRKKS